MASALKYRRFLLKLSGESLMGDKASGLDPKTVSRICKEIAEVHFLGAQISLVIGAGNIFRGMAGTAIGIERTSADYMGMLATVINGLALQSALENMSINTRLMSAVKIDEIAEPFIRRRAIRHLEKGRVIIFVAGTGNPYFTTDTAAVLRAIEINADIIMKGTRVDGIFSDDPEKNKKAIHFKSLSFDEVYEKNLSVMDMTAVTLCKENRLPISVFNINKSGNLLKLAQGDNIGTIVHV